MGYNRRNLLMKIIDVQKITLEHKEKGITQKWIYENLIFPKYFISKRTFDNWLCINAKREFKAMNYEHNI
jgi:hypothetical protein